MYVRGTAAEELDLGLPKVEQMSGKNKEYRTAGIAHAHHVSRGRFVGR